MVDAPAWRFAAPQSWSEVPRPSVVRSTIEDGYPKVRRRFTKAWAEISVAWTVEDQATADAIGTFFSVECADGTLPFTIADPRTGATRLVRWKAPPQTDASIDIKPAARVSATLEEVFST